MHMSLQAKHGNGCSEPATPKILNPGFTQSFDAQVPCCTPWHEAYHHDFQGAVRHVVAGVHTWVGWSDDRHEMTLIPVVKPRVPLLHAHWVLMIYLLQDNGRRPSPVAVYLHQYKENMKYGLTSHTCMCLTEKEAWWKHTAVDMAAVHFNSCSTPTRSSGMQRCICQYAMPRWAMQMCQLQKVILPCTVHLSSP